MTPLQPAVLKALELGLALGKSSDTSSTQVLDQLASLLLKNEEKPVVEKKVSLPKEQKLPDFVYPIWWGHEEHTPTQSKKHRPQNKAFQGETFTPSHGLDSTQKND
jgi:hypothetical protein